MKLWFPYVATLMIFIWVINMLGFMPLPLTGETYHGVPVWGIYAATSSLSVTLALALMTWIFTHIEGIRYNGPCKYVKSWIPEVPKAILPMIIVIEVLSQFMRLISLSVRLYANMLAGHILILTFIGLIFVFETLFAVPLVGDLGRLLHLRGRHRRLDPGVHLRRPVRHLHRLGDRARTLRRTTGCLSALLASRRGDHGRPSSDAGKAIALALGIGLGAAGAGAGIGNIFGSMIQSVARQPELRGELQGLMWLGFALTEAVVFYGFVGGLLGYVLV